MKLGLLAVVALALLGAALPATAAAAAPAGPCPGTCSSDVAITHSGSAAPAPCIRDAGCGGGGVLSANSAPFALAIVAPILVVVAGAVRRRRPLARRQPNGWRLASRLFHPPRFAGAS